MYKGFNLILDFEDEDSFKAGNELYEDRNKQIRTALDTFLSPSGSVNASALQESWFPQMEVDIFLSHSHKDKKLAITLAGLLNKFGLSVFVDSCIWGNADDLLRQIDNKFCYQMDSDTYSYQKRNISTSHVHMMLSVALAKMIDRSECLFFLNTPNSINSDDIMSKTASSWLYAEISMAGLVRQRELSEYRKDMVKGLTELKAFNESLNFEFDVPMGHLERLTDKDIIAWIKSLKEVDNHPLNNLYKLKAKSTRRVFVE
jgi:hypothetical protein